MKTIETKLYSYAELSAEAKANVFQNWQREQERDECLLEHSSGEMLDSMKALATALNFRVTDWSIGSHNQNWDFTVKGEHELLRGNKALAVTLRALLNHGYSRPKTFNEMEFPGVCGFTGVCYDDDFAEAIWKSLQQGMVLREAFDRLAYEAGKLLEGEYQYLTSEECFQEQLDDSEEIYTEGGEIF